MFVGRLFRGLATQVACRAFAGGLFSSGIFRRRLLSCGRPRHPHGDDHAVGAGLDVQGTGGDRARIAFGRVSATAIGIVVAHIGPGIAGHLVHGHADAHPCVLAAGDSTGHGNHPQRQLRIHIHHIGCHQRLTADRRTGGLAELVVRGDAVGCNARAATRGGRQRKHPVDGLGRHIELPGVDLDVVCHTGDGRVVAPDHGEGATHGAPAAARLRTRSARVVQGLNVVFRAHHRRSIKAAGEIDLVQVGSTRRFAAVGDKVTQHPQVLVQGVGVDRNQHGHQIRLEIHLANAVAPGQAIGHGGGELGSGTDPGAGVVAHERQTDGAGRREVLGGRCGTDACVEAVVQKIGASHQVGVG